MKLDLKKSLLAVGVVSSLALASVAGAGAVSAASSTNSNAKDGPSALIDKIATKFHLNKTEVKAVFDEERASHNAERKKANETRLTQAVNDGKITEAQKALILSKQAEIRAEREANRDSRANKTNSERKADMEAKRSALEKWATDNNIPIEYLHPGGGHGGPGHDGPGGHGEM